MLRELQVQDLALVERARVGFGPGLNLLTGETGSGKSLIVDALGLALGARATPEQVRAGAERARVEALFDLEDAPAVRRALTSLGQEPNAELVLSREIGRRGGARINGRPATPGQLRELGRLLVGIHGQHEQRLLLDQDAQTSLLDAFAGALAAREAVAGAHAAWAAAVARLDDLQRLQARGRREEEYLRWQLQELQSAGLRPGEDEELAAERAVVRHAARLLELVGGAIETLRGDESLSSAAVSLRQGSELDPRLREAAERLEAVTAEVADLGEQLRHYLEAIDADPARLEAIESRLSLLDRLKRRYGSLESAIAERDRLQAQLATLEDLGGAIERAGREAAAARAALEEAAATLTRLRAEGAARLGQAVSRELTGLRLEGAVFEVGLHPRPEIAADGAESAEMRFSANPGEAPAPLARVASGGELSRVMLAVRTVGAEVDRLPTLVFDEVDTGIGGETAVQVGLRLKALGGRRQVLVVTHLAQIACFADHHLVVEKVPGPEGRNVVRVQELDRVEDRARELARMMSGGVTEKALARARELLEEAGGAARAG
ncbi:MAG TPA: DNA repair protein RecN [Candidatus Dormibacteraeota bacterium]|nr:DNA repair protein RecN [Candidatus Dormibacteraeota bacterium]